MSLTTEEVASWGLSTDPEGAWVTSQRSRKATACPLCASIEWNPGPAGRGTRTLGHKDWMVKGRGKCHTVTEPGNGRAGGLSLQSSGTQWSLPGNPVPYQQEGSGTAWQPGCVLIGMTSRAPSAHGGSSVPWGLNPTLTLGWGTTQSGPILGAGQCHGASCSQKHRPSFSLGAALPGPRPFSSPTVLEPAARMLQ
jgi:hypothetical protein